MKIKFLVLGMVFSLVMVVYWGILVKIQLIETSQYKQQVEDISQKRNVLQALRGRIYDRYESDPLAYNVSRYQVLINPREFVSSQENISKLARVLEVSEKLVESSLSTKEAKDIIIKDKLTYEASIKYIEDISGFRGISWKRVIQREYREDKFLSHVLGYVGDISETELQALSYKGYRNFDIIGKVGIEKEYEELLRGKAGVLKKVVDVRGKTIDDTGQVEQSILYGNDLVLTIDSKIQHLVEQALGERVGAAIVLKPSDGEILAMASYPNYNLNFIVNAPNNKELLEIQKNVHSPFLNRAIQSVAPPASTFKVLMSVAYLNEDIDNHLGHWTHTVFCPGYIEIAGRIFKCWAPYGHGTENYIGALADSCNVFFYSIGTKDLGVDIISSYAKRFGLGELTGIDIPGEVSGTFPTKTWKKLRYGEQWLVGDTANLSIGQGYVTTTPLQLANLVAGILNKGKIYKPHFLKEVKDQTTGGLVYSVGKEEIHTFDLDAKVANAIESALRNVAVRGSSRSVINTKATSVAGKTGSAQVIGDNIDKLHSWYISYAPHGAPVEEQVVVVVWIDAVNEWEWWAPKAADIIYQGIFADQTYEEATHTLKAQGNSWWLP